MATAEKQEKKAKVKVLENNTYGTGKRKTAIAKVWLFPGKGNITVNQKDYKEHFVVDTYQHTVQKALKALQLSGKYDVVASVQGGGLSSQADAVCLGVARAFVVLNEEFKKPLKDEGLLTRDSRIKERKKYGRKRARKGFQYRKR